MSEAKRIVRWMIMTAIFAVVSTSCDKNSPPGDYSSVEGIYTCQESSPHSGLRQYPVEIDKVKGSENLYIIVNFHNKGQSEFLYAELDDDLLLISNQFISNIRVDGEGTVDSDFKSIQLNYLTDDGATVLNFYSSYTR